jgi:hypothetical protein
MCPRRADTDDSNPWASQRRSGPVTSRHPSVLGGTPPVPRIRNNAATKPVMDRAATTRRTRVNMVRG